MEQDAMISVILPVYNAGRYLERCLEGILKQSYGNFELIAVDDGSTDDSLELLTVYSKKDRRITVNKMQHGNVSSARNLALSLAKGEYAAFIDADDWCEPDYLGELKTAMDSADSDMAVCGCREISGKRVLERYLEDFDSSILDEIKGTDNLMAFHAEHDVMGACWCKLYKTRIIRENRIKFSEKAIVNSDIVFNMEYLLHSRRVNYIRKPLYNYVKYSSSLSSRRDPEAALTIDAVVAEKTKVLGRSRLSKETIDRAIVHWKFRATAFACYREIFSGERIPFSDRIHNTLRLVRQIRKIKSTKEVDWRRIKPRTRLFVCFTYLLNRLTIPFMLAPFHMISVIKDSGGWE